MPQTPEAPDPGTFAQLIMSARPNTERELSAAVREVVAAVKETGKAGTISLKLSIAPVDGDVTVLTINDAISKTVPQHDRKGSMVFPTAENDLTRSAPGQTFHFDTSDLKDARADASTGEVIQDARS